MSTLTTVISKIRAALLEAKSALDANGLAEAGEAVDRLSNALEVWGATTHPDNGNILPGLNS